MKRSSNHLSLAPVQMTTETKALIQDTAKTSEIYAEFMDSEADRLSNPVIN